MRPRDVITIAILSTVIATGCSKPGTASSDTGTALAADAAPTVPPQGVYNSCEIDTALTTMCEQEDAAMASDGFTWEINYIGIMAHKTGPGSLQAWFTYDASIGMGQVIAVKEALNDPSGNALTGTKLVTFNGDGNLAADCGAKNNQQLIACIHSVADAVPGFKFKWYIYDEPGCPNQSIGYCQGTLAGHNYKNVEAIAKYVASIDPSHQIIGAQVGDAGDQTVIDNLFSWLMAPPMPETLTGFDRYPIPSGGKFGSIADIGSIARRVATAAKASSPSANIFFVGQAFSWYQEHGAGCTSVSVCPYPTTRQLQEMRDQALYHAAQSGRPLSMIFWYYWPDVTCLQNFAGCNAAANRASLRSAAFAAFPASAP